MIRQGLKLSWTIGAQKTVKSLKPKIEFWLGLQKFWLGLGWGGDQLSENISFVWSKTSYSGVSRPSGLEADGSMRKRCPGWGVASAGTGKAQTLRNLTRGYHWFHYGGRWRSILNLPCFLILAPHPSCHLAFPLLFVRAAGDEGDPVWLGHPTILPGLVMERTRSPGDAPPNVLLPTFSNQLAKGRGKWEREGWKHAGGFQASLDRVKEFGPGMDEGLITPIKNLPSRWKRMRKAWRRGPGMGRGAGAGGRERSRPPATFPNEFEELFKNSNEEKIYTNHPWVRWKRDNQLFKKI